MAEPLKNSFGPDMPQRIAESILRVHPAFDAGGFVADCLKGYEALDLTARGRRIAESLKKFLPEDYPHAVEILVKSLGPKLERSQGNGMAPFFYMPHVFFVAAHGLDHWEESMRAQYELTQRFSAEFSIRAFLEKYPAKTLARLKAWTRDESEHVRRLVSEGTRPRLPWAPRLKAFMEDPAPVLKLLELLKDDPSEYVRRSVANNLNDIGKDHPKLLAATAKRWLKGASPERRRLVRHALRSAVKRGEGAALKALGYGGTDGVEVVRSKIAPKRVKPGGKVAVTVAVANKGKARRRVVLDLRVHFRKAKGKTGAKVFKLKSLTLAPGAAAEARKTISLARLTTRRHYPGRHAVEALLNGKAAPLGAFVLSA